MLNRSERDVVHGKPGTPPPSPKPRPEGAKEKKPFEDRVLQKALDYLKGQIKAGARVPQGQFDEVAHG
jgi:hypothetical protein